MDFGKESMLVIGFFVFLIGITMLMISPTYGDTTKVEKQLAEYESTLESNLEAYKKTQEQCQAAMLESTTKINMTRGAIFALKSLPVEADGVSDSE